MLADFSAQKYNFPRKKSILIFESTFEVEPFFSLFENEIVLLCYLPLILRVRPEKWAGGAAQPVLPIVLVLKSAKF